MGSVVVVFVDVVVVVVVTLRKSAVRYCVLEVWKVRTSYVHKLHA